MLTLFRGMVKVLALKERVFGDSKHPASPEARAILGMIMSSTKDFFKLSLEENRKKAEKMASMFSPPKEYKRTVWDIKGVRVLWCELDKAAPDCPVLVHFHGGGLATGTAEAVSGTCVVVGCCRLWLEWWWCLVQSGVTEREGGAAPVNGPLMRLDRWVLGAVAVLPIFQSFGAHVAVVDFPLCPEHSPVEAIESGVNTFEHLVQNLHIDPARIVIIGESAGGLLAINVAAQLRNHPTLPRPACAVSWSAWLDLTNSTQSANTPTDQDMIFPELMRGFQDLIPKECDKKAISPTFMDLAGLPPVFVSAGGAELLIDENRWFVERCHEAGVEVRLTLWSVAGALGTGDVVGWGILLRLWDNSPHGWLG